MFRAVFTLLVNTPFYPHWLSMLKANAENDELISHFYGRVLETGCGNCVKKERALRLNKKITEYVATDYSSWDEDFAKQTKIIESLGMITRILYGKAKDKAKIDVECNALNLQFRNNSFDIYYNHSVLEYIEDPIKFFAGLSSIKKR
jgi:ubiquinone/menaquinone biosynthesis C-methylase UbiE